MAGVFERLQKQIEKRQKESGITLVDLAELPVPLRKIMRIMLRQVQMKYQEVHEAIGKLPEQERMTRPDLDEALSALSAQSWLIQLGEGEQAIYRVNLRRKAGSRLSSGIWHKLDAKLKDNPEI